MKDSLSVPPRPSPCRPVAPDWLTNNSHSRLQPQTHNYTGHYGSTDTCATVIISSQGRKSRSKCQSFLNTYSYRMTSISGQQFFFTFLCRLALRHIGSRKAYLLFFTGVQVQYVEIWPNFGFWGTPVPKRSNVHDAWQKLRKRRRGTYVLPELHMLPKTLPHSSVEKNAKKNHFSCTLWTAKTVWKQIFFIYFEKC